jgi:hypothetical protein
MWEHGGYLESVWQDGLSILGCVLLQCHDIGKTSEMRARVEVTGTISTNAIGRCAPKLCKFCGDAECMFWCTFPFKRAEGFVFSFSFSFFWFNFVK